MKILIDDLVQRSNAPAALKSAALAETYGVNNFIITLDTTYDMNCIGVGYTDANHIVINGETIHLHLAGATPYKNGLYLLTIPLVAEDTLTVTHDGTYLGRFGAGAYSNIYASPSRELGMYTTQQPRVTVGGQVVPGVGGYCGRRIILDFRYKFDSTLIGKIQTVFNAQIATGLPVFVYFDKENFSTLWARLYASIPNDYLFQGAVRQFLMSHKLEMIERF
jgi:hypothetical protein